jgi:segregation and condensation protein B
MTDAEPVQAPAGAGEGAPAAAPPAPPDGPALKAGGHAEAPANAGDARPSGPRDYRRILEALLFASDRPLTAARLHEIVPELKAAAAREILEQLKADYAKAGHAFELVEIAEGYQLLTRPGYEEWIARLKKVKAPPKLTGAALETLAIIAYKQPIRRVDVEAIRGVQSGELVRALMERGLVKIVGRADQPGAPLLYGTTKEFLDVLGLKDLSELPKPDEVK